MSKHINIETSKYKELEQVYIAAVKQAESGKGKERHANDGEAFEDQLMSVVQGMYGAGFTLGQATKKMVEACRLVNLENGPYRAEAELYGAINYIAGAIIRLKQTGKLLG